MWHTRSQTIQGSLTDQAIRWIRVIKCSFMLLVFHRPWITGTAFETALCTGVFSLATGPTTCTKAITVIPQGIGGTNASLHQGVQDHILVSHLHHGHNYHMNWHDPLKLPVQLSDWCSLIRDKAWQNIIQYAPIDVVLSYYLHQPKPGGVLLT